VCVCARYTTKVLVMRGGGEGGADFSVNF
jgi:hypothetical protein